MMRRAKALMVQGTASSVGKSTLVTGLCRIFAQEGYRVAPFKAQNMSLNAAVTRDGGEIGRAQAVQAEAAGVEARVEMNPILLKPESKSRSQVIVMGRPLPAMEAREYYRQRSGFVEIVQGALETLQKEYDLIVIEGAGSPVELNLKQYDLVNMRVAEIADAPVLLVGDIDRGGIFASLLGTLQLLRPEERARVKGLIVNRFRGDLALWREGEQMLAEMSGVPVLGTVPYIERLRIAEEDSVALDERATTLYREQAEGDGRRLNVVLVRLPYLSNYDEFDALAAEPLVTLHVVGRVEEFPERPDLIVLPGTKNTFFDLAWLWRRGLATKIRRCASEGSTVLGICGGFQMLGERLSDPYGVETEAGTVESGLGLLAVETVFGQVQEKVTTRTQVRVATEARRGLLAGCDERLVQGYQIHVGRTMASQQGEMGGGPAFVTEEGMSDGWVSEDGWCVGWYVHGLLEDEGLRRQVVEGLVERRALEVGEVERARFSREEEYERLAGVIREYVDMGMVREVWGLLE